MSYPGKDRKLLVRVILTDESDPQKYIYNLFNQIHKIILKFNHSPSVMEAL